MFSLVQFDNGETCILPSKRVKITEGQNCIVKYPSGTKYNADLLEMSGKYLNGFSNIWNWIWFWVYSSFEIFISNNLN